MTILAVLPIGAFFVEATARVAGSRHGRPAPLTAAARRLGLHARFCEREPEIRPYRRLLHAAAVTRSGSTAQAALSSATR